MNPALKDIVKEELQKLLDVGFIYPISKNEWVSPLVLVPKKNGKWRIFVDYHELNKATKKDHFPLPFIDQVLDGLVGKKFAKYSQESTETRTSSTIPSGVTVEQSANCSTIEVFLKEL